MDHLVWSGLLWMTYESRCWCWCWCWSGCFLHVMTVGSTVLPDSCEMSNTLITFSYRRQWLRTHGLCAVALMSAASFMIYLLPSLWRGKSFSLIQVCIWYCVQILLLISAMCFCVGVIPWNILRSAHLALFFLIVLMLSSSTQKNYENPRTKAFVIHWIWGISTKRA